jgi:hypothetical protein
MSISANDRLNSSDCNENVSVTHHYLIPSLSLRLQPQCPIIFVFDVDGTIARKKKNNILIRPGWEKLIGILNNLHAEVIIWTAGNSKHFCAIESHLNFISGNKSMHKCQDFYLRHVLVREDWLDKDKNPTRIKDLDRLGRDTSLVLMIENNPKSGAKQPNNTLLVPSFDIDCDFEDEYVLSNVSKIIQIITLSIMSGRVSNVPDALNMCNRLGYIKKHSISFTRHIFSI